MEDVADLRKLLVMEMSDNIIEGELYFAEVKLFSGKYHIFKEGKNVCLCGRYSLPSDLKDEDKVKVFDHIVEQSKKLIGGNKDMFLLIASEKEFEETLSHCNHFMVVINRAIKELGIKHEL